MIASTKTTQRAEQRWNRIVERFRAACILHGQGQAEASRRVVKEELPILVKAWIQMLPAALRDDAKADLRDMFEREQALVDRGFRMRRALREALERKVIPELEAKLSAKYRSLYVERQDERRRKRESQLDGSWVRPSYAASGAASAPAAAKRNRLRLDDVSGMIDALQTRQSAGLAESAADVEAIVDVLQRSGLSQTLGD